MLEGSSTRVDPLMVDSEVLKEVVWVDGIEEWRVRGSLRDEVREEVLEEVFRRCMREVTESIEP
jgi:hypothetical protein